VYVALRFIAAWFGLLSVIAALFALKLSTIITWRPRATLFFVLLLGVVALGAYAAVQLWRLRESGRRAGIAFCLLVAAYVLAEHSRAGLGTTVRMLVTPALVLGALVLPAAARACEAPVPRRRRLRA
jgi:uncharacterized membrane protein YhaH (DUF805 family)